MGADGVIDHHSDRVEYIRVINICKLVNHSKTVTKAATKPLTK